MLKYETESNEIADGVNVDELILIKNMYCIVLSHYLYSVKGGWQQLEETVNFLLLNFEKVLSYLSIKLIFFSFTAFLIVNLLLSVF